VPPLPPPLAISPRRQSSNTSAIVNIIAAIMLTSAAATPPNINIIYVCYAAWATFIASHFHTIPLPPPLPLMPSHVISHIAGIRSYQHTTSVASRH